MPKTKVALASRFHCVCGRAFWSLIKSCLSAVFIYPLRQHSSRARRRLRYQGTCIFPFISSARICMEKIPPLSRAAAVLLLDRHFFPYLRARRAYVERAERVGHTNKRCSQHDQMIDDWPEHAFYRCCVRGLQMQTDLCAERRIASSLLVARHTWFLRHKYSWH